MKFDQAIYTSTLEGLSGQRGWQFAAASDGLGREDLEELAPLMGFSRPGSFGRPGGREVDSLPVALTHAVTRSGRQVEVCARHAAPDEFGRLNHIAHALLPQDEFSYPIELWGAPGWATSRGKGTRLEVAQVLPSSRADRERLLVPLSHEPRPAVLAVGVEYLLRSWEDGRRVIVVDEPEGVAAWIAVLSFLLPPSASAALTFTTFTSDVTSSTVAISGTLERSDLRVSALDRDRTWIIEPDHIADGAGIRPLAQRLATQLGVGEAAELLAFHDVVRGVAGAAEGWTIDGAYAAWCGQLDLCPADNALRAAVAALSGGVSLSDPAALLDACAPHVSRPDLVARAWEMYCGAVATNHLTDAAAGAWIAGNALNDPLPDDLPAIPERPVTPEVSSRLLDAIEFADSLSELVRVLTGAAALGARLPHIADAVIAPIAAGMITDPACRRLVSRLAGQHENALIAERLMTGLLTDVGTGVLEPRVAAPLMDDAAIVPFLDTLASAGGPGAFGALLVRAAHAASQDERRAAEAIRDPLALAATEQDVELCLGAVSAEGRATDPADAAALVRAVGDAGLTLPPRFVAETVEELLGGAADRRHEGRRELLVALDQALATHGSVLPPALRAEVLVQRLELGRLRPDRATVDALAAVAGPRMTGSLAKEASSWLARIGLLEEDACADAALDALASSGATGMRAARETITRALDGASPERIARIFETLVRATGPARPFSEELLAGPFRQGAKRWWAEDVRACLHADFRPHWEAWTQENLGRGSGLGRRWNRRRSPDPREDDGR